MMKTISIAAITLAMTAGVAAAQSTTDRQGGAALFDQGGDFQVNEQMDGQSPVTDNDATNSILPRTNNSASDERPANEAMPETPSDQTRGSVEPGGATVE